MIRGGTKGYRWVQTTFCTCTPKVTKQQTIGGTKGTTPFRGCTLYPRSDVGDFLDDLEAFLTASNLVIEIIKVQKKTFIA